MIIIKVSRSWVHVGPMPLFRVLVLDGAAYFLLFIIVFSLAMVANANDVVCRLYLTVSNTHSLIEYSFIIPSWIPSTWKYLQVGLYSDQTNSVATSINVVACNHLMLSLRKAANSPNSREPPSQSLTVATRPTTDLTFIPHASDVTYSYDDRSATPQPTEYDESAVWNHKQGNPEQKPSEWHEMKTSDGSTASVN